MKKILITAIVFVCAILLTMYIIFLSMYEVVRYGDAPLAIHEEISYIKENIIKNGIDINDGVEVKLSVYILDYCDFPSRPYFEYVNYIYPQNRRMEKYKKKFMEGAADYRNSNPITEKYFEAYIPEEWRARIMGCWNLIEKNYGKQ